MLEVKIYQKDCGAHTKFYYLPDGNTFPEDNFEIARKWHEQGLLSERSSRFMQNIIDNQKNPAQITDDGVITIEI